MERSIEDVLRPLTPQVIGALVRRYGHLDTAEDAAQEAFLAAARQWPHSGIPDQPRAWLIRVGSRKLIDLLRAEQARRRREETVLNWETTWSGPAADTVADDTLVLLTLCCHPSLSPTSQVALTLRSVGGLTTGEIARSFLTSEASMARRISRAKRSIQASGLPFRMPPESERAERLESVLSVLYLIFTEGYAATSGPQLQRPDLTAEAIRLAELARDLLPHDEEVAGLQALMLLTDARTPARTNRHGDLIPIRDQDRTLWKTESIRRGVELITWALRRGRVGPYQLQAAIAAVHDKAASAATTDWRQIANLYQLLIRLSPSPVARLNHAVAVAMAQGPEAGLALLDDLDDRRLAAEHRPAAARAHLLEMSGDRDAARAAYVLAASQATNLRHVRYLNKQVQRLDQGSWE